MDILFTNDGNDLFAPGLGLTTAGKAFVGQFNRSSVMGAHPTAHVQQGQDPFQVRSPASSISLNSPISVVPSAGPMLSGFNADSGQSLTTSVYTDESGCDLFSFNLDGGSDGFLSGLIGSEPLPALPLPALTGDPELERMVMELVNTSGISFEEFSGDINPLDLLTTVTSPDGSDHSHDSGVAVSTPASQQSGNESVEVTDAMIQQLANNPALMDSLVSGQLSLSPQPQIPLVPSPAPETPVVEVQEPRPIAKAGKSKKPKSATYMGKNLEGVAEKLITDEAARKCPVNGQTIGEQVTKDKLANMPIDDFNAMLENNGLEEVDVAVMKEWRRRNKNKSAAQVARKRKRDEVKSLDDEVADLKKDKKALEKKLKSLPGEIKELKAKAQALEKEAFARGDYIRVVQARKDSGDMKGALELETWLRQHIQRQQAK